MKKKNKFSVKYEQYVAQKLAIQLHKENKIMLISLDIITYPNDHDEITHKDKGDKGERPSGTVSGSLGLINWSFELGGAETVVLKIIILLFLAFGLIFLIMKVIIG